MMCNDGHIGPLERSLAGEGYNGPSAIRIQPTPRPKKEDPPERVIFSLVALCYLRDLLSLGG